MENNRGFLQDVGKLIDFIQELAVKIDILATKIEEALDLLKEKNGSD